MTLSVGRRSASQSHLFGRLGSNESPLPSLIQVSEGSDCVRGARRPNAMNRTGEVGVGDVDHG